MKYRKKPVVIEAEQFYSGNAGWPLGVCKDNRSSTGFAIDTLEGRALEVTEGDWIITGGKGERYPCKPGIFEQTYEKAGA